MLKICCCDCTFVGINKYSGVSVIKKLLSSFIKSSSWSETIGSIKNTKLSSDWIATSRVLLAMTVCIVFFATSAHAITLSDDVLLAAKVVDLETSEVVYQKNEKLPMRPASTLKLYTFFLAMKELGPDYTFKTTAYESGDDLYIAFSGDPTMTQDGLETVVLKVKESKSHYNNVYLDGEGFGEELYAPGWNAGDLKFSYAAPISQFMVEGNTVRFLQREDGALSYKQDAKYETISVSNAAIESQKTDLCPLEMMVSGVNKYKLSGCYNKKDIPSQLRTSVTDPKSNMVALLKAMFESNGITVNKFGFAKAKTSKLVAQYESPKLTAIAREMLVVSDNQIAEVLAKTMALKAYNMPATWYRVNKFYTDKAKQYFGSDVKASFGDGSGLSSRNLLSADFMESLVSRIYNDQKMREIYLKSMPYADGIRGTMRNRFKDSKLREGVVAKTGTLYDSSSLAGIYQSNSGKDYSFSIVTNNLLIPIPAARDLEEKLLEEILQ